VHLFIERKEAELEGYNQARDKIEIDPLRPGASKNGPGGYAAIDPNMDQAEKCDTGNQHTIEECLPQATRYSRHRQSFDQTNCAGHPNGLFQQVPSVTERD